VVLTAGRWLVHRALGGLRGGGALAFAVVLALGGAAFTEWAGVHAIFGAFLVGVAVGDSAHLAPDVRGTLVQFSAGVLAPIFFASIALRVDFVASFDAALVGLVLVIGCAGKLAGCGLGARLVGRGWREAAAIAFAMNARGAMEDR